MNPSMTSPPSPPSRLRSLTDQWLPLLVALLLTAPALRPLWQPGLQQTDDGVHHLFRLFNLDLAIRAGYWGARWLADEGFGYGFPVFNFYAPLTYYAGLVLHWLGAGFVTTLEWTLAAGLLLAVVAMFFFARELVGPWGAALAAVAYTWAPYHIADTWTRAALAEQWAFVWIPLLLLALLKIARAGPPETSTGSRSIHTGWGPTLWGGLALAGLVLTHNLTVILAAPVLVVWALFLLVVEVQEQRLRCLGRFFAMALLGLLLSAAFWLPAIAESQFVLAGQSLERFEDWAQRLEPPRLLLELSWRHPYAIVDRRIDHPMAVAQALVALLGVLVGIGRWRALPRLARLSLPLWLGFLFFALFMQSELSEAVWRVPGMLLLQFPWRWQMVGALATAMLSGYLVFVFPWALQRTANTGSASPRGALAPALLVITVGVALISAALPRIPFLPTNIPTTDVQISNENIDRRAAILYDFGRGLWLREYGSPWMFEYIPVEAAELRRDFFLSAGPLAPESQGAAALVVQMTPGRQRPLERRFTVSSDAPWTLQLRQFYFPGWEALVNGAAVPAQPTGDLALAGVTLPAGQHEVVFRFGLTPPRQVGWALTLLGMAILLAGAVLLGRWRWLALAALLLLGYVGLAQLQRQAQPNVYTPAPVAATFGAEAQLIGLDLDPSQLQPDGENEVVLNWLALRRPANDYKVFLHLVDLTGALWAQHDGEPGSSFTPTTRWQPGEFIEDRHQLEWRSAEAPPPGRYLLFAGLYDPATGQRLPVTDLTGQPIGDQVLLGEFDLP